MKKSFFFIGTFFLFSCTSVVYTHKQVMDDLKSKEQVIAKLGLPTNKMVEGEYEQWYYDYGTVSRSKTYTIYTKPEVNNTININVNPNSGLNFNPSTQTSVPKFNLGNAQGSTVTNTSNKFVKVIFRGENVFNWESQSVDFSVRGRDKTKTALLLGPVGLFIK
jgi:hypothetical protein